MRGSLRIAACLGALALVAPAPLVAHPSSRPNATTPEPAAGPANFDVRWDLAAARAGKLAVDATRAGAEQRLAAQSRGLTIHRDDVSLLPKMVAASAPGGRLSAKGPVDAVAAARGFLEANRDVYGLSVAEIASLRLVYTSAPEGGATIVRLGQYVGDVPVFGAEIAVVMTPRDHAVAATAGVLYPEAGAGVATKTQSLAARDALAKAAADLTGRAFAGADFAELRTDEIGYTHFEFGPDRTNAAAPFFGEGVRARQVVFPIAAGETIPAFYVEVVTQGEPAGSGPCYSYVISAVDGAVLARTNLVNAESFSYRVYADTTPATRFQPWDSPQGILGTPHPTGVPDSFQAQNAATSVVTIESLLGPTDPWLAPGALETVGNNVEAYLDITGSDGYSEGDVRGATTTAGNFNYEFDHLAVSTDATVRQSKTIHLFYFNNWLHDIWYEKGFNEASRNAQTNNFGRGGAGNDSLKAEGEDQSGANNANMFTPADGSRPRMQMYRFTGAGNTLNPQRDSSHDFGIVAHEWMHYMSNRLVGNANGLNNKQGGSMGEGWGDWNGLICILREGDDFDGVYTTGAWATSLLWSGYTNNYYFGIRRYPYSTRMDRFPLAFGDINGSGLFHPPGVPRNTNISSGSAAEVHNAGEVWCNMLWEASASLLKTYGFATGRDRIMQYVADGMKNTPSSPTFGDARQAIVNAANAAHPEDVPLLWQAFAKRGIGENAVSPPSGSNLLAGIVESYVAPVALPNDSIGFVSGGVFFERNVHLGGAADNQLVYGAASLVPLVGNWKGGVAVGADSADTPGAYDPATGAFFLRNSNTPGAADLTFTFGPGGVFKPLAGDWNGDGTTTVGIYNPATGAFFLRNSNTSGPAEIVLTFGGGGALVPIVGDWNNDGIDTVGLYDPATGTFFLRDSNTPGPANLTFSFGAPGGQPLVGDWNDDGTDTIGVYNSGAGVFFLRNTNGSGAADRTINFGAPGAGTAIAGNFDGQ
jgi:hypothetical protein